MKYAVLETSFFELLANDPVDVVQEGRFYFNSTSHIPKWYNGTQWVGLLTDPMTTRGDIIYRDASAPARLAIGTTGKVLQSDGTDPKYDLIKSANIDTASVVLFQGGNASAEYVGTNPEVGGASPFQLLSTHKRNQILNPGAAITVLLPTTNIKAGEVWRIFNRSVYTVSVQSSDASPIATLYSKASCSFVALQDTPTTELHWEGIERITSDWQALGSAASDALCNWENAGCASEVYYKRSGGNLEIKLYTAFTGAGANAATTFTFPNSLQCNTTPDSTAQDSIQYGTGTFSDAGVLYPLRAVYESATTVKIKFIQENGDGNQVKLTTCNFGNSLPVTSANGDKMHIVMSIPISGWTEKAG